MTIWGALGIAPDAMNEEIAQIVGDAACWDEVEMRDMSALLDAVAERAERRMWEAACFRCRERIAAGTIDLCAINNEAPATFATCPLRQGKE